MRWPIRPLVGLTSFLAAPVALAQTPIPNCPPLIAPLYPNCPPSTLPGTIPLVPGSDPNAQLPQAAQNALRDGGFSRSAEGGGLSASSAAPNMDGDLVGARALRVRYSVPLTATFFNVRDAVDGTGGSAKLVNPRTQGSNIVFGPTPNGRFSDPFFPSTLNSDLSYVQPTAGGNSPDFDREFARAALQTLLSRGQLTGEQVRQLNKLGAGDRARLLGNRGAVNAAVTQGTRGLGIPEVTVSSVGGNLNGDTLTYTAVLTGERNVALPGSSSSVGRLKLSEDTSPMPRDRVIFGYDTFEGVPFTDAGITVNRFMFGFEKTFLDGRWSAEVRLPFAGTLASSYTDGFETKDVELGNLRFALKRLWTNSEILNFSSGVGVTLPTANDQVVLSQLGGELYRFKNQSVTVEPFVAVLYTPNDRFFAQAWTSVNIDTSGGELTWDPAVFGGTGSSRIWDLPYLAVDGQIGYWMLRRETGTVRGLAPFVELHYNYAIAQDRLLEEVSKRTEGQGITTSGVGNTELNITAGIVAQLGEHTNLTLGVSAPLLERPDRTFNAQFGLRLNYFYGSGGRQRSNAARVGTY